MYMRTAQYFIRKQSEDKSWTSTLADYCLAVKDGAEVQIMNKLKDKVV